MTLRRVSPLVLVSVALALVACSDRPTDLTASHANAARVVADLPGTVPGLAAVLFDPGNANAGQSRWSTVLRLQQRGDAANAQKHMFDLADFVLKKQRQEQLRDPDGAGDAT